MTINKNIKLDFPMPKLLSTLVSDADKAWDEQGDSFEYIYRVELAETQAKQDELDGKITACQRTMIFNHFGLY